MKKMIPELVSPSKPSDWGVWSPMREWVRGGLHFSIGLLAWLALHPFYRDDRTITISLWCVVGFFSLLEVARIAVVRSNSQMWFIRFLRMINTRYVDRFLVRESERCRITAILQTAIGFVLMWYIGPRWIDALAGLLLGVCDPIAKLGKRCPIYRFKNKKSVGGVLFGMLGGVACCVFVLSFSQYIPLFPTELSAGHVVLVYATGALSAPIFELFGGKWDNLMIVAGSTTVMTLTSWLLLLA